MDQEIKIIAEPQMVPENCKFTLDRELFDGPSVRFISKEEAKGSALPEAIFDVGNIGALLVTSQSLIVTQAQPEDWRILGKKIGAAIRTSIQSGKPLISEQALKSVEPENELRKKVSEVLEKHINPAVASHGGIIELLDVRNNDIFIKMGGGCQGCGSATATLKQGVEQTLRQAIPTLGAIYDTTDHASGKNPYYAPSGH